MNLKGDISKMAITVVTMKTKALLCMNIIPFIPCGADHTRAAMNRAFAGVGSPLKTSACEGSLSNFASRNAENNGISKGKNIIM